MSTNTEAPMSVTIQSYYKGFSVMITKRDPEVEVSPLIKQSMEAIEHLIKLGFEPSWNKQTSNEALGKATPQTPVKTQPVASQATPTTPSTEEHICSVHNASMKSRIGKNDQVFYSHNRGVYPNLEWCQGKGFPTEKSAGSSTTAY